MSDQRTNEELREQIASLEQQLRQVTRTLHQTERVALRSESIAVQSKRARLRTDAELEHRVEDLRAAKAAAEDGAATQGRFLATMSHELRTPLNGMVGSADLLLAESLSGEQRRLVELLHRSADALLTIVNDVLDYSRLEADRMPIECASFRLAECVEDVVELQRHVAKKQGIELSAHLEDGLPQVVFGDAGRLRQVLMNLLTNALKFTAEGSVEVRVASGLTAGDLIFSVTDTGMGIEPAALATLFEAFTQAETSTARRFGGTGLGLAVTKRLVTLMGGAIRVDSEPGQGTTFTFTCSLPESRGVPTARTSPPVPAATAERGAVLVVDDNPSNRLIAAKMLTRLGFSCDEAVDGADAVARASARDYRLILMDCNMPVMDGYEAAHMIRTLPEGRCDVPIVALTAYSMPGDEQRCREAGMDEWVTKPVRLAELCAAIDRLLSNAIS